MTERGRDIPPKRHAARTRDVPSPGGLVKLYYRIGEVAQIVGVAPHVLRYWESEFPSVKPQKSTHGQRVYTKRDVHKLLLIKSLLKEQGLTIAGARKQLRAQSGKLFTEPSSRGFEDKGSASETTTVVLGIGASLIDEVQETGSPSEQEATHLPGVSPKSLRQALLSVRRELVDWLSDLQ